jgi:hypothetical protein
MACLVCEREGDFWSTTIYYLECPRESTINQQPDLYNPRDRDDHYGGFWREFECRLCNYCYDNFDLFSPLFIKAKSENHAKEIFKFTLN